MIMRPLYLYLQQLLIQIPFFRLGTSLIFFVEDRKSDTTSLS